MRVEEHLKQLRNYRVEIKEITVNTARTANKINIVYEDGEERISQIRPKKYKHGTEGFRVMEKILNDS